MERANGLAGGARGGAVGRGAAIVDELVRQGRRVRAVGRSGTAGLPAGVEWVRADLYDPADAARAVAGASVVYHAAQPAVREVGRQLRAAQRIDRATRQPRPVHASCSPTTCTCTGPAARR